MDLEQALAKITDLESKNNELAGKNNQLAGQLKGFGDVTPDAIADLRTKATEAETLKTQAETYKTQAEQLQGQVGKTNLQFEGYRGLTQAGVLPEYAQVGMSLLGEKLVIDAEGNVKTADGKTPAEAANEMRDRYPQIFAAPPQTNGTGQDGQPIKKESAAVYDLAANNGVIRGVNPDDVLEGKVSVQ